MPNQTSAIFQATTSGVDSNVQVEVAANLAGVEKKAKVTLAPARVVAIEFAKDSVVGGSGVLAVVKLDGLAGPSGAVITLKSLDSVLKVPATVTVADQTSSISFNATSTSLPVASIRRKAVTSNKPALVRTVVVSTYGSVA